MESRLTARNTVSEAWKLYQLLFGRSVLTAAVVFAPIGLFEVATAEVEGTATIAIAVLFAIVLGFLGDLLVQGALVEVVRDVHEARPPSPIGALYERTRPRLGALLLGTIVYSVAFGLGLVLLIVPGLLVLSRWSLIVPVIVIEQKSSKEARKRSSALVRGQTGRVLWIVLATLLFMGIATSLIAASLFWIPSVVGGWLAGLIAVSLTTPFGAHVLTVLYYRLTEPERPVIAEQRPRRWKTIWEEERVAVRG
jgi:hypothetical protein